MCASRTPTEFLSFPVCGDCGLDFDDGEKKPLLLPCQHVFCKSCLNDQEDSDCQNCCTCRENWSNTDLAKLLIVYDLIPSGEDGSGKEVTPGGRKRSAKSGKEVTASSTSDQKGKTGREVTPIVKKGRTCATHDKSLSSARFPACNVCVEDFNMNSQRPLRLPCGHCFCQSCLEVLRNSAKSECPKCRSDWSKEDMNRLPIVKSLIHPSNTNNNVPRRASATGNRKSDDDIVKAAATLSLRNNTQTMQQKQTKSEIYVRDTRHRTHALQVDLQRDNVTQLRLRVQQVTGVLPAEQRLLYNSQQLEDGRTLAHYNIQPHETIFQTCRLKGGSVLTH